MEGILLKQGKDGTWKERLFRVEGKLLKHTELDRPTSDAGSIDLDNASVTVFSPNFKGRSGYLFSVTPVNEKRIYVLETSTELDRSRWISAFCAAGAQEPERESARVYIIEGILSKKSVKNETLKKRYCGVEAGKMEYTKEKGGKICASFELAEAKIFQLPYDHEKRLGFFFGIVPQKGGRSYYFVAESNLERARWMQVIRYAGAVQSEVPVVVGGSSSIALSSLQIEQQEPLKIVPQYLEDEAKIMNSAPPVYVMEGFLYKKGAKNTAWKERFFGIDEYRKLSYRKEKKGRRLGVIDLDGAMVHLFPIGAKDRTGYLFGIVGPSGERMYVLEASSEVERANWVTCLKLSGAIAELPHHDQIPVMEGFLWKRGEKNKAWKERYFILEDSKLHYAKQKNSKKLGSIEILHSKISISQPDSEGARAGWFSFTIQPSGLGRIYILETGTDSDRQKWIDALLSQLKSPLSTYSSSIQPSIPSLHASPIQSIPPPPPPASVSPFASTNTVQKPPPFRDLAPPSRLPPQREASRSPRVAVKPFSPEVAFPALPRCLSTVQEELPSSTPRPPSRAPKRP